MVSLAAQAAPVMVTVPMLYVFCIRVQQDPQAFPRVFALFAQRGLVPDQICCRKSGSSLVIDIEVELGEAALAVRLLERMRSMVLVDRANLVEPGDS